MVYKFDGYNYFIRLNKNERLNECLQQLAAETKIKSGWVSGLGGALAMTLGFYDLDKKQYVWRDFTGLFEITALQGSVAVDESGKHMFHLHGTFADANYQAIGGHVKDLTAAATVELFVYRSHLPIKRRQDDDIGLKILDL